MKPHERTLGAAAMAVLALAGLAGAWSATWFEYDHSSGRQTAPDGAYNDGVDGVVRHHLAYDAGHWNGDVQPDAELAHRLGTFVPASLATAAGALALVALGEIPLVDRIIRRRIALALVAVALAAIAAAAVMAWSWMPESMAAYGVDSQFSARLDEPSGYTSSNLSWGWYAAAASFIPALGAGLFKFQAGQVDLEAVAGLMHPRRDA
jgi:hypothetical protein